VALKSLKTLDAYYSKAVSIDFHTTSYFSHKHKKKHDIISFNITQHKKRVLPDSCGIYMYTNNAVSSKKLFRNVPKNAY
jgi:hypothetical protein